MNFEYAEILLVFEKATPRCLEAIRDFVSTKRKIKIVKQDNMNSFTKTPFEIISLHFYFAPVFFNDTEIISSYTVTCFNAKTGINTKATIISSDTNNDTSVMVKIHGGTVKDCHKITARILSSDDNFFEIDLLLDIFETVTDRFKKQPGSKYTISNDFNNDIASSDSISSVNITVVRVSDGSNVTGSMFVSSCVEGTIVYFSLCDGTDEQDYIVSVKVSTTDGFRYEKLILMLVREM